MRLFDLSGKVALVTGGTRGLGLAMARALADAGAKVAVVGRSQPQADDSQSPFLFMPADLSTTQGRAGLIERVVDQCGSIDILLHAAGNQIRHEAAVFPSDDFDAVMAVHVTAAMDLAQQSSKFMLARQSGKIILVSSVLGFQGGCMVPAYVAAKHSVIGLARALTNEWARHGINVNTIAPGYFDAGVAKEVIDDPLRGPKILERIPAGRYGDPTDLTGAAVFLASESSNYVHGHTLVVDGGWLSR